MEQSREAFYYWHGLNGAPPTCPEFNSPEKRDPSRFSKRNPCSRKYKRGGFYGVDRVKGASLYLWRAQIWVKDDPSVPRSDHPKDKKGRYLKIGGKKSLLVAAVARDLEARYRGLQSVVKFNFDNTMLCIMMCCMDPWDPMPIPAIILHLLRSKLPREYFYTIHPTCACISALPPREPASKDAAYRNPLLAFPRIRGMLSSDELARVTIPERDPPPRKPALPPALAASLDPSRANPHAPPLPMPAAAATAAAAAAAAVRLPSSAAASNTYGTAAAAQAMAAASAMSGAGAGAGAGAASALNGGRGTRHSLRPRDHLQTSVHLRPLLAAANQQSSSSSAASSSAASSSHGMPGLYGRSREQLQFSSAIPMGVLHPSEAVALSAAHGTHMTTSNRDYGSRQWDVAASQAQSASQAQAQSRGKHLEQSPPINIVSVPTSSGVPKHPVSYQALVTSEAESRASRQGLSSSVSSLQIGPSSKRPGEGDGGLGSGGTSGRASSRGGGTNRSRGALLKIRSEETVGFRAVAQGAARSPSMGIRRRLSTGSSVGTASTAGRAANKVLKSGYRIGISSRVDDSYLPSPIAGLSSQGTARSGASGSGSAPGTKRPRPAQHRHARSIGMVGNGTFAPSNGASGGPGKRRRVEYTGASGGRMRAQLPQPSPEEHREAAEALVGMSSQARSETPGSNDGSLSDARSEASSLMDGVGGNLGFPSYTDPPSLHHPLFSAHSASSMQPSSSPSNVGMYPRSSAEYSSIAVTRAMAHGVAAGLNPRYTQLEAFGASQRPGGDLDNGQFDLMSGPPEDSGDQAPELLGQAADASHLDRDRTSASQNDPRDFGLYRIVNSLETRPPPISIRGRVDHHDSGRLVPSGLRRDISSGSLGRSTSGLPIVGAEGTGGSAEGMSAAAVPEAAAGMAELSDSVMNGETTPGSVGSPAARGVSSSGADWIGGHGTGAGGVAASSQLGSDSGRSSSVSMSGQPIRFVGLNLPTNSGSEGVDVGGLSPAESETSAGVPRGMASPCSVRSDGGSRAE